VRVKLIRLFTAVNIYEEMKVSTTPQPTMLKVVLCWNCYTVPKVYSYTHFPTPSTAVLTSSLHPHNRPLRAIPVAKVLTVRLSATSL